MRVLFVLPGLHRYNRGAEIAFTSIATELANLGTSVTLIGSGQADPKTSYRFLSAGSIRRENFESFPHLPLLRSEYVYEELTFVPGLLRRYRPSDFDVTVTCSYPFTNWILRRPTPGRARPRHVFVTQNGDWAPQAKNAEYQFFGCDGLVCTNPDYFERNKQRWCCKLIPNGVDCNRFSPGPSFRQLFGLPTNSVIILMVSALIPSKRIAIGIEAVGRIPNAHLVVAGDGPQREEINARARLRLPGRFTLLSVAPAQMPSLYRSSDVFMHLSKDESFGNVYLEAMACGLPVVAHDSPRTRWITGDHEFLADTDDSVALTKQIELASSTQPTNVEKRVAKALNFSWPKIGAMYRNFLEEVVSA